MIYINSKGEREEVTESEFNMRQKRDRAKIRQMIAEHKKTGNPMGMILKAIVTLDPTELREYMNSKGNHNETTK